MTLNTTVQAVTERIVERSRGQRSAYLDRCRAAAEAGPGRAHLGCGNLAHADWVLPLETPFERPPDRERRRDLDC